jgi:hypothetical protein
MKGFLTHALGTTVIVAVGLIIINKVSVLAPVRDLIGLKG